MKKILRALALVLCLALGAAGLYGCNVKKDYSISFYADGERVAVVYTRGNQNITLPSAPQKPGSDFVGWFFGEEESAEQLFEDTYAEKPLQKDISVYAHYRTQTPEPDPGPDPEPDPGPDPEPQEYAITFYADGKQAGIVYTAGNEKIALPAAPVKSGYTFVGWYFDENVWSRPVTEDTYLHTALESSVSVYAKYEKDPEPQEYAITFYADGKQAGIVYTAGNEKIALPAAPVKSGYTFVGWYFDENVWSRPVTEDTYLHTALESSVSVYAKYEKDAPAEYTVTFVTNGGETLPSAEYSVIESAEDLPVPIYDGYDFVGWYLDADLRTPVGYPYALTGALTLYAKWEKQTVRFTVDSKGYLTAVEGVSGSFSLEIPSKVNGVTVTGIGNRVFEGSGIQSVVIPSTVRTIGSAFKNCKDLTSVTLSEGLTSIWEYAFYGCTSLQQIRFPDSLREIHSDAFQGSGLTSLSLNKVTSVWQFAFKDCASLASLDLGSVRTLGLQAFENCVSLRSVSVPSTLQSSDMYIFAGCTRLEKISLPSNGVQIHGKAFYGTAYAEKAENWQNGLLFIDGYLMAANEDFAGTRTLSLPAGTVCIADGALSGSSYGQSNTSSLETVTLPQRLCRIGAEAFLNCSALKTVNAAGGITSIGKDAFEGTALYNDSTGENWYGGGLYIGNWLVAVSKSVSGDFVVKEGTEYIIDIDSPNRLFPTPALNKITSVTLPSSLRRIGNNAFKSLSKITSIKLPAGLESIGENAFSGCIALASVNLGDCASLREIGTAALMQCAFTQITVPASVQTMGYNVFNQNDAKLVVYCEAASKPAGWSSDWDYDLENGRVKAVWGQKQP